MRKLLGFVVAGLLFAGSANAATLPYGGALVFQLATLPGIQALGSGLMVVNGSAGGGHLTTMALGPGGFGPVSASVPVTSNGTINSVIFTALAALSGTPVTGSAGAPMGLTGTAKICLVFAPCAYAAVTVPLTPTASGGFGVGGTQVIPGAVAITMQHNSWTLGTPTMTIHTASSNVTTPTLPGGFVHGAASGALSTAAPSGVVQLVAITKTYTSLTGAFPELPLIGIIQLHFVPEPGTLLLLVSGVVGLAILGRSHSRK
jgi:hypothetical protein